MHTGFTVRRAKYEGFLVEPSPVQNLDSDDEDDSDSESFTPILEPSPFFYDVE